MALNLEIWSVMIGLMELGCALTWNHDEQFVEGDFPYYPYTNRIYAYADTGDGLTDARIRSDEFSGYKIAMKRWSNQEKRKSLYAFNKDSNKLIDATKLNVDEQENVGPVNEKHSRQGRPRHFDTEGTEKLKSAEFKLKSAESEASGTSEHTKPNNADTRQSGGSKRFNSNEHDLKYAKPQQLAPAGNSEPTTAEARHSGGSKGLQSNENDLKYAKSGKLATPEPHDSAEVGHLNSDGSGNVGSTLRVQKYAKSQELAPGKHKEPNPAEARHSGGSKRLHSNSKEHPRKSDKSEKSGLAKAETSNSDETSHLDSTTRILDSAEQELKPAKSKEENPAGNDDPESADSKKPDKSGFENAKLTNKSLRRNQKKANQTRRRDESEASSLTMLNNKRKRRNSGLEASLVGWKSRKIGESNSEDLWAHGIRRNMTPVESSKRKTTRESMLSEKSRKITLVAPYETNYTGGGFRSVNPSSWLAKEIERFIRRKDHRWLDFMRNTGMDVNKKRPGIVSQVKRKSEKTQKMTSRVDSLAPSSEPYRLDMEKLRTEQLINRIDSLLADLNQFRSSLKNGWSDTMKIQVTETGQLMNYAAMDRRKHRLRRGIKFSRTRPPAKLAVDLVENDLQDLKKNVVLCQNQLPDKEKQALEDMKLHIKVYVEKDKQREREDHHMRGSEVDYRTYPENIHLEQ